MAPENTEYGIDWGLPASLGVRRCFQIFQIANLAFFGRVLLTATAMRYVVFNLQCCMNHLALLPRCVRWFAVVIVVVMNHYAPLCIVAERLLLAILLAAIAIAAPTTGCMWLVCLGLLGHNCASASEEASCQRHVNV